MISKEERMMDILKSFIDIAEPQLYKYDNLKEDVEATKWAIKRIKELETREQKLIDKLEDRIKELKNKLGGNTYHVQAMINAEIREVEKILSILKGE